MVVVAAAVHPHMKDLDTRKELVIDTGQVAVAVAINPLRTHDLSMRVTNTPVVVMVVNRAAEDTISLISSSHQAVVQMVTTSDLSKDKGNQQTLHSVTHRYRD